MDEYVVKLYPRAFRDIDDIYAYIAIEKQSPENARALTDRIKDKILSLSQLPQSHQDRLEGRYADKGYKQLLIDHYLAIFKIDEANKTVYVITVQYQGRNL